ncbi:MAG: GtrA family protein [Proteobacteria bacterium]|nr:GtrA family protein [Pseudomonadota bacterium]
MITALQSRPGLWRFVKFLFVGVLNTAFGFLAYAFFLRVVHLPWAWALAVSYIFGVLWNFMTHGKIVFMTQGLRRLPLYVLAYVVIYTINKLALHVLIDNLGVSDLWAQAILVLPIAMVAFVLVSLALTGRLPFAGLGKAGTD